MSEPDLKLRIGLGVHDSRGLVWGYRLDCCEALSMHEMPEGTLEHPVWLHFNLADGRARTWISEQSNLPEVAVTALLDPLRRVRVNNIGSGVTGIIEDLHHDFHGDPEGFGELRFYVDEHRVISGRRHPLKAVDALHRSLESGEPLQTTARWLEEFVEAVTRTFADAVHDLVEQVDEIEDEIVAGSHEDERARLANIRRLLVRFRRHLHSNRGALGKLRMRDGGDPANPSPLRQTLEQMDGVVQDLDLVHERVRLLQEEVASLLAEDTNRNLYVLSIVTTVLLPATLLTGVWGMNVGGLPWSENPHGFWWTALGILTSVLLSLALLRGTRVL